MSMMDNIVIKSLVGYRPKILCLESSELIVCGWKSLTILGKECYIFSTQTN